MPDPGGKGIYFLNGRPSGSLAAYHPHSKQSTDIVPEDAIQPIISRDGKRVMYSTLLTSGRVLWTSDIDGGNRVKIAIAGVQEEELLTLNWSPDNFHLFFSQGAKLYMVAADGSGIHEIPSMAGKTISNAVWSPDRKSIYVSTLQSAGYSASSIWRLKEDARPEILVEECGFAYDVDPSGEYLLALKLGENAGIYEVSVSERKCSPLLTGVTGGAIFDHEGKSLLYPVASHKEISIFRQSWRNGKIVGTPQAALKLPFSFPLNYGDSYDFSRDLSTVVYVRSEGHADLYLLNR